MKDAWRVPLVLFGLALTAPAAYALDLETVLRDVRDRNPMIAMQRSMTDAATHRVPMAGAWPNPMLELGAVNVPQSGRIDEEPMTMQMVGVVQRVPLFGRTGLARRAAREGVTAANAATEMTAYEMYGMAWEAYAEAYFAAERRAIAEGHQGTMGRMVASARARYEAGPGRLEDVLRAESERARTLADLEMFRAEERAARARLEALRGNGAMAPARVDALEAPPLPPVPADAAAWLAAVGDVHPRLRELEARERSERFAARAARRMAWPDLELGFSWGFREDLVRIDPAMSPMVTTMEQDDMWSARVAFMLPIFARSREFAEGRERDAMADAARAEKRNAELELEARVAGVHAEAVAMQRAAGLMADTVLVTQRRALDASWSAYTAGTADLWRTLEAAHGLYNEELALSRTREALSRAFARFLALTGRGDLVGVQVPAAPGSGS